MNAKSCMRDHAIEQTLKYLLVFLVVDYGGRGNPVY